MNAWYNSALLQSRKSGFVPVGQTTRFLPILATLLAAGLLAAGLGVPWPGRCLAQAVSELPRVEYYLARELLGAGRVFDAIEGFEAAGRRARRVGDTRWIDSIPPLVMLGEAYYEQGNLAAAMERYDAALMLAIANPAWIDGLDNAGEPLPELDFGKGINWFPATRPMSALTVPAGIQIALDPTQAQVGPDGGLVAPVSLVTRLDVSEVLRTMGIALYRRWQILGPLTEHSPLTAPLEQLFSRRPSQPVPWLQACWQGLQGLSQLGLPTNPDAVGNLRAGALVGNRFDYFLSPIVLLALADLEASEGTYQSAVGLLGDASLLAGLFEQHQVLAEITHRLSACAAAGTRADMLDVLQSLATWTAKRSNTAHAAALLGVAELSSYAGSYVRAERAAKQCVSLLRQREISMPREQARLAFINAHIAYAQNRGTLGNTALIEALSMMQGSADTGAVVPRVFQTQMALDLLASGGLTANTAESILADTLAEPSAAEWRNEPLETLASITTASLPAYERRLELMLARRAPAEELLPQLDRLQRQKLYEALPLGGRLLAWRSTLTTDPQQLAPEARQSAERALQGTPALRSLAQTVETNLVALQQQPLELDERQVTAAAKKQFGDLLEAAESFESLLRLQAVSRIPLGREYPTAAALPTAQQQLADGDLLIGFVRLGGSIVGIAITADQHQTWRLETAGALSNQLPALFTQIGLGKPSTRPLPSAVGQLGASWKTTALEVSRSLFSSEVQPLLAAANRVLIVPNRELWYVPFELLPIEDRADAAPWIASLRVTYLPTLGSLNYAYRAEPVRSPPVTLGNTFFALDRERNEALVQQVAAAAGGAGQTVMLSQKVSVPSASWLRLLADRVLVATEVPAAGWDTVVFPIGGSKQGSLREWIQTPRSCPQQVMLPGLATSIASGSPKDGNDLLLPTAGLLFSGTQAALISRWPVGGTSTAVLTSRYLEELGDGPPSQALRIAVLANWAEQYLIANEPALLPAGKEAAAVCSGDHPLLWSGYMAIGDAR